jgi:uncharacterized lipoprotein NlpE involved in copper resistance
MIKKSIITLSLILLLGCNTHSSSSEFEVGDNVIVNYTLEGIVVKSKPYHSLYAVMFKNGAIVEYSPNQLKKI